ncbi:MAG: primase-helicase family protein [Pseudomonas putida]
MNGYSVTGSATRASTGNPALDKIMAEVRAVQKAEAERKAAKKAAAQTEAVTRTVLTAEPSKSVSATITLTQPAANEPVGEIQFGKDIAQPQTVGNASGLLASMKQAQEAPVPRPVIDLLGFFNGLHMEPDEARLMREYAIENAKDEAESEAFANARLVDPDKVAVTLTDAAWTLFRAFASDYARNATTEKAHELATGDEFGRNGLRDLAAKFYGTLCGHNEDGHPVRVCLGSMWWRTTRSEDVRVITRVVMEPTATADDHTSKTFNQFHILRRKAVRPDLTATREDIKLFDDHLLYLTGGCEVTREYVLNWLAHLLQKPDHKPATGLVFVSPANGTGKSWLFQPLKWMLGPDLVSHTGFDALFDGNDGPFIGRWLVFMDEVPRPHMMKRMPRDPYAKLKRLTTQPVTTLRPMYEPAREMRTPCMVIALNEIESLGDVAEGRRFCIAVCHDQPRGKAYYDALFEWSGIQEPGPGVAKLAGYLSKRDISKFDANADAPLTSSKLAVRESNRSAEADFLDGLIEERRPPFDKDFGRTESLLRQLDTLFPPAVLRGMNFTTRSLPRALKELGHKVIGVDGTYRTTDKGSRMHCWRNFEKWDAASRKERNDHLGGDVQPFTVLDGGRDS